MNSVLLLSVGLIYVIVGAKYFIDGQTGLGVAFLAYAVSNYGLYLAGRM